MKFLIILSVIFIVGCSSQELLPNNASSKPEQNFNSNRENLHSHHTYVHKCPAFIFEQDKNKNAKSCHWYFFMFFSFDKISKNH